uniref:G-protein coupled receptors family 1 profile domain-containing protein n=1 Tax=Poecilia latipinna TaxID=48699 RepID=A0A3B3V3S7_9TELE
LYSYLYSNLKNNSILVSLYILAHAFHTVYVSLCMLKTCFQCFLSPCHLTFDSCTSQIFRFNPRYILFIHLVLNKTLQMTVSVSLYILAHAFHTVYVSLCMLILLPAILTTMNTPLNLACMAAECYISVCIPLRYDSICTVKKTYIVIGIMWVISLLTILPDIFILLITEELHFLKTRVFYASHIFFLVVVCLTLFYTYFRIFLVAKAANSDAKKAKNTILLHGFQMLMCMTLFVQPLLKQLLTYLFPGQTIYIQNVIFVLIQIIPRCLSPVVYGIRDRTFRMHYKKYFMCFQVKEIKVEP